MTSNPNLRLHLFLVLKTMEDLGVNLILGERLDLESTKPEKLKFNLRRQRVVKTMSGKDVAADLMVSFSFFLPLLGHSKNEFVSFSFFVRARHLILSLFPGCLRNR